MHYKTIKLYIEKKVDRIFILYLKEVNLYVSFTRFQNLAIAETLDVSFFPIKRERERES